MPIGPMSASGRPIGPISATEQPIRLTWQPTSAYRPLVGRQALSAGGCPTGPAGGPEADRAVGNPGATGLSPPLSHAIEPPGVFSEHKHHQA